MITKETALSLRYQQELHYGACSRSVGPRGGIKESIIRVRVSGQTKTWKTRPEEFRVPVKYGLYESAEVNERNASQYHLASDCPARVCTNCGHTRDEHRHARITGQPWCYHKMENGKDCGCIEWETEGSL